MMSSTVAGIPRTRSKSTRSSPPRGIFLRELEPVAETFRLGPPVPDAYNGDDEETPQGPSFPATVTQAPNDKLSGGYGRLNSESAIPDHLTVHSRTHRILESRPRSMEPDPYPKEPSPYPTRLSRSSPRSLPEVFIEVPPATTDTTTSYDFDNSERREHDKYQQRLSVHESRVPEPSSRPRSRNASRSSDRARPRIRRSSRSASYIESLQPDIDGISTPDWVELQADGLRRSKTRNRDSASPRRYSVADNRDTYGRASWTRRLSEPSSPLKSRVHTFVEKTLGLEPSGTSPRSHRTQRSFQRRPSSAYSISIDTSPNRRSIHFTHSRSPSRNRSLAYERTVDPPGSPDHSSLSGSEQNNDVLPNPHFLHVGTRYPSQVASTGASPSKYTAPKPSGSLGVKTYQYEPLLDREIRLVKICPETMTMIRCEIETTSLDKPRKYIAVSYAWGDADNTQEIKVNKAPVPIAVSLHGALDALRKPDEPTYVWVDALCIDQQNKEERAEQVRLMNDIYKKACSVAIWLGPEEDDSDLALGLLRSAERRYDSPEKMRSLIKNGNRRQDFIAVVSLFERDYWRRLWVVQEIFNGSKIRVYCGDEHISWAKCKRASEVFYRHKADIDLSFPRGLSDPGEQGPSQDQFAVSQVLAYQGPLSIPKESEIYHLGADAILEVMRTCRR